MAINFTSFLNAPHAESPWKNALENVFKGYQISQAPAQMAEEKQQRQLANALKSKALEHYEEKLQMARDLNQARINKANRSAINASNNPFKPTGSVNNIAYLNRELEKEDLTPEKRKSLEEDLAKEKKGVSRDSRDKQLEIEKLAYFRDHLMKEGNPNYQHDYDAAQRAIERNGGKESGKAPKEPEKPTEINLPDGGKGYVEAQSKTKTQPVTDMNGNLIGYNEPMDKEMIKTWKATEKFKTVFPFINKALSYYSGSGSWSRYIKDAEKYSTDPAAKRRIDDFLAARDLMKVEAILENGRLGGHNTNVQLEKIQSTLDSSEVNQKLLKGSTVALPKGYAEASGKTYQAYLDQFDKAAKTNIPSHEFRYLNPKQNSYEFKAPEVPADIYNAEQYAAWFNQLSAPEQDAIIQEQAKKEEQERATAQRIGAH